MGMVSGIQHCGYGAALIRPALRATFSRQKREKGRAHNFFELFAIVKKIIDAGGQFLSLAEPWADTSTSTGRLMIAVLGGLADVERDLIRTRTGEGRARAKLRGQHMGRPPKMTAAQKQEARRRRKDGESVADLARSYERQPAAIYRTTAAA